MQLIWGLWGISSCAEDMLLLHCGSLAFSGQLAPVCCHSGSDDRTRPRNPAKKRNRHEQDAAFETQQSCARLGSRDDKGTIYIVCIILMNDGRDTRSFLSVRYGFATSHTTGRLHATARDDRRCSVGGVRRGLSSSCHSGCSANSRPSVCQTGRQFPELPVGRAFGCVATHLVCLKVQAAAKASSEANATARISQLAQTGRPQQARPSRIFWCACPAASWDLAYSIQSEWSQWSQCQAAQILLEELAASRAIEPSAFDTLIAAFATQGCAEDIPIAERNTNTPSLS